MDAVQKVSTRSFPQVSLLATDHSRGAEVFLISQLPPGAGDALITRSSQLQSQHPAHHDALDEPSALLSAPDIAGKDPASLHSFTVGRTGHPFHCHASSRVFTAISGSSGALLRFSNASQQQLEQCPERFPHTLHHVSIPADCLFSVRMAPAIWHQFLPADGDGHHPAMFALSCHPDEAAGQLSEQKNEHVNQGHASIAALTHLLPSSAHHWASMEIAQATGVTTTALTLDPPLPLRGLFPCAWFRRCTGKLRQHLARVLSSTGSVVTQVHHKVLHTSPHPQPEALFVEEFAEGSHHQDVVRIAIPAALFPGQPPTALMSGLLRAFIEQPRTSISLLMRLRNALVRPLRLRTSPLGCPVSSLLLDHTGQRFANRFPVLGQTHTPVRSAVLLGNNDRHLRFRSCVSVEYLDDQIHFSLATRVRCLNAFGHVYMTAVNLLHRHYIAPTMLRAAVQQLLAPAQLTDNQPWLPRTQQ